MNGAAMFALAEIFIAVELLEQRGQVTHDTLELDFSAMHKLMALLAIPLKAIQCAVGARHFDDHPNASRLQPLRRMPHMLWEQENFSLLDWNFEWRLTRSFHQPKKNVALQLIKEFFRRIVVIVATVI